MADGRQEWEFGRRLAAARRKAGLSQLRLALAADISARHMSFLESGRARPSAPMVARLVQALGLCPASHDALLLAAGYAPRMFKRQDFAGAGTPSVAEAAFQVALDLDRLDDAALVYAAAAAYLARLGLEQFFCGVLKTDARGAWEVSIDIGGAPPVAWLAHYRAHGYREADPLVAETAHACAPFYWDEVRARRGRLSARQEKILDEAGDFRIRNGFVLPIRRPDGSVRAVSAMSDHLDSRDPAARLAARIVCTGLLEALDRLRIRDLGPDVSPSLAPDLAEVLRWARAGQGAEWVAQRLGLPAEAVERRLAAACQALGVVDLPQAVVRAQAYGLLNP